MEVLIILDYWQGREFLGSRYMNVRGRVLFIDERSQVHKESEIVSVQISGQNLGTKFWDKNNHLL
jgi:hypothetical protein